MPLVSVVIPTYQRARFLGEVLGMVLRQTHGDIEVIVADDGSTDGTPDVVHRFVDPRVRYVRREHLGMPGILNEGFAVARGAYVMTCHDHDLYAPSLLAELAAALDESPTAAYAHCGLVVVDPTGRHVRERHVPDFPPLMPGRQFLIEQLLPGLDSRVSALTMIRASALAGELFDPTYGFVADVEMWLRLAARGDVAYVAKPLIRVRERDASSELHHVRAQLALHALRAKRAYLRVVAGRRQQHAIERGWRRDAARTVLRELLHAKSHDRGALAQIRALADEAQSPTARLAVWTAARVPRILSVGALSLLRRGARYWRDAHGTA